MPLPYSAVLFDLDGTLTDPGPGITASVAYALARYGIEVPDRRELYPFIGPPLAESFSRFYGFSEEKAREAVEVYREYFSVRGLYENSVYDGIPEMLKALCERGAILAVASSKPEVFVKRILDHFSLTPFFTAIAGSELNNSRTDKHEVIEYLYRSFPLPDRAGAVMVGDRRHDVIGGHASSLPVVGVTYGYGSREELSEAGADRLADSVSDLAAILTGSAL